MDCSRQMLVQPIGDFHRAPPGKMLSDNDRTPNDPGFDILDILPDAALLLGGSGRIRQVGNGPATILGYSPAEVLAFSTIDRFLGLSLRALLSMLPKERESIRRIVTKSGAESFITLHVRRVPNIKDGWLCILRDATLQHERDNASAFLGRDLSHAAHLARQGQLLESIVHEIRQPMAAILFSARSGQNYLAGVPGSNAVNEVLCSFENIFRSADLSLGIIDRLRRLASQKPLNMQRVDLNHALQEVVDLLSIEADARRVELRAELAQDLPSVRGDAVAIQHMIMDLLMNAIEAAETNPEIRIVVARTCHDGPSANLVIQDNGPGIPPNDLPSLFDAYFTTKETGSGLGLAIAKSVVDAHGGSIGLDDCAAAGCAIRVTLPLSTKSGDHSTSAVSISRCDRRNICLASNAET